MNIRITPGLLSGKTKAIPSKSQAHRMLICAAFAQAPTRLVCSQTNRDIQATAQCLTALGADIHRTEDGYEIHPAQAIPTQATLPCRDSGSTLRFLLPVVGALGVDATFMLEGRLAQRPLSPLWEEMERMGCCLSRPTPDTIRCQGKLKPGGYQVDGGISSQFITGLLFAAALIPGVSRIQITGQLQSRPYVDMTRQAMARFGCPTDHFQVTGGQPFHAPGMVEIEGDWSNAAFFLAAQALGNPVTVENLAVDSPQGDRAVAQILPQLENHCEIDAGDIPDLVPILAVVAAARHGAVFRHIRRLRLKESDRVATVCAMLNALGARAESDEDSLTVFPAPLTGGTVDSANDHRIAMSAAIAATVCTGPVTILGAECVEKSDPQFWAEYRRLGGTYEQYLW